MKTMKVKPEESVNGDLGDDGYHLGHFFMDYMTNYPEDCVWQIDAGTGETESKSSVKSRSIRLARCLRNAGLRPGDVAVVSGRNHLDVHIPFYAAYMNGLPMAGIDPCYKYEELKHHFETTKPKIIFCEVDNFVDTEAAVNDLGLDTKIVTFGDSDQSLAKFMKMYDDDASEHTFQVATFDTKKVFAWLVSTSGSTGLPKVAAFRHSSIFKMLRLYVKLKDIQPALYLSSVQWISSYLASVAMITANNIKVQSSLPITIEHAIDIINTYRPVVSTVSPTLLTGIVRHPKNCDLTCFSTIIFTGSSINNEVLQQLRLVDLKTGEVIVEPNRKGELWSKGPRLAEYYNNPEATARAFTSDGWYKTEDILYRDENGFYFFVDRMCSILKFRSYNVKPMEVERVIHGHPDVLDVCVVGIPHPEDGEHAAAVVTRRPGTTVTEQEIKDIVASKLSIYKHLHGGVIFVDNFPRTVTGKIIKPKVIDMVLRDRASQSLTMPK